MIVGFEGLGRRVIADSVITLGLRIANILLSAAVGILVSRALGPEGRAIYQIPGILAGFVVASFSGLTTAVSYAMLHDRRGRGALTAGLVAGFIFVTGGIIVVVVLGVLMRAQWAIAFAALALPSAALVNVATGYWYGASNVRYANLVGFAVTLTLAIAMVLGFTTVGATAGTAIAMWLIGMVVIGLLAVTTAILHARHLPPDRVALRPFLTYAVKVGLVNVVSLLNYRIDVYIVAVLLPPTALGLYTVAVTGAESLTVLTQIGASATLPYIAGLERREAADLTGRCARISVALAVLLSLAVWFAAPFIVVALYGMAFHEAVPALRALLGSVVALAGAGVLSSYFTLNRGQPRIPLLISIAMAVVGGVLTLLLVPPFGIVGAGVATTISYAVGFVLASALFVAAGDGSVFALAIIRPSDIRSLALHARNYLKRPRATTQV